MNVVTTSEILNRISAHLWSLPWQTKNAALRFDPI